MVSPHYDVAAMRVVGSEAPSSATCKIFRSLKDQTQLGQAIHHNQFAPRSGLEAMHSLTGAPESLSQGENELTGVGILKNPSVLAGVDSTCSLKDHTQLGQASQYSVRSAEWAGSTA